MHIEEARAAERKIEPQREKVKKMKRNGAAFQREFQKLTELTITAFGNAWCMDVKGERRKMAKLVSAQLKGLL